MFTMKNLRNANGGSAVRGIVGLLGLFIQRLFLALLILAIVMIGYEVISRRLQTSPTEKTPHTPIEESTRPNGLPLRRCGGD
jgi:hypothetical protein